MKLALIMVLGALTVAPAAWSQQPPATPNRTAVVQRTRQQTVYRAAEKIGQEFHQKVLVVSALNQAQVPLDEKVDGEIEAQLDALVKKIPGGSWAKVYLPIPENGQRYNPDAVAQFAQAQAGLFRQASEARDGSVALQGRKLTAAEAQPHIQSLKLEPYFVVMTRRTAMLAQGGPGEGPQLGVEPAMDALLKQLGVSTPKDIPPGDYEVTIPGPDGNPQKAQISVMDRNGGRAIAIRIGNERGG